MPCDYVNNNVLQIGVEKGTQNLHGRNRLDVNYVNENLPANVYISIIAIKLTVSADGYAMHVTVGLANLGIPSHLSAAQSGIFKIDEG